MHLCGRLQLKWDGELLEGGLAGRQGRLLLAFLTLHRERLVRRDELVAALWSEDGSAPGGDELLRPPLSRLRSALGPGRLEGRGELAIRFPADTWVDREAVREGLRQARALLAAGDPYGSWEAARDAFAIADHGLLPGLEAVWLEPFRTELEEQRLDLLEMVARAGVRLGDGELPEAELAARAAIDAAPFRESARVALLDVLHRRGNVAEALVAFDQFRIFLREELGTSPGPELREMHGELLRAGDRPRAAPSASGAAGPSEHRRLPDRLAFALSAPWVGRAAAIGRLRDLADQATAGSSGLVLVGGDGGIGKTRLVAELATSLPAFDVLYGRCDEEEIFPYGPWVDLLRPRLAAMGKTELATVLGAEASDIARLVPELRPRVPSDGSDDHAGDPETERRLLFMAVARVVGRLARRRPLLVVIDDLHWADRSSLLLGRHLAREPQLGRVLLLGTFRDTELGPGHPLLDLIADVERDRPVARVQLGGMEEREIAALIESWHGTDVRQETVQAIRAETEGNPFFVKQLVRHLEEVTGEVRLTPGETIGVPQGVQDVIKRRVARLPDHAGHVLRVAALIGRDFEFELLEQVTDVAADPLLDVLDAAVAGALLSEVPSAPGHYSFTHALLRSTMVAELSVTRRAMLHRRIGEALERSHPDRIDDLARHFAEAGREGTDRAVGYAVRAAAQATDRLAHDEAVRLLTRAVALRRHDHSVDQLQLAELESALGAAEAGAGLWEVARQSFARAAEAARAAGTGDATAAAASFAQAALGHSGGFWEQYGRDDADSVALLEEALQRLPSGDSSLRSQVLARLAVLLYYAPSASEEQQRAAADAAVAIARRVGDPDALTAALAAAQHARWRPGPQDDRLAIIDELIEVTENREALPDAAVAHLCRAGVMLERCELAHAEPHFARVDEIADRVQQYQLQVFRDGVRAMRALLSGDYGTGATASEDVLEWGRRASRYGSAPMPVLLQTYGVTQVSLLNERSGLGHLTPLVQKLVDEIGALPGWRAVLAWSYLQGGHPRRAAAELEAISGEQFAAVPIDVNLIPTLALVAHVVGELGDAALGARAEPILLPFRDRWVVFGMGTATLGPVAYSLGLLQLVQDRLDDAAGSFELALERSLRMRARPYVARSRAGLADALGRRGQPGDAARAKELFALAAVDARELGMTRLQRELARR